ncbi:MAG: PLP-dependent aminotransferase family protein [Lautropia sp.]|nr:PLP-dependent aminotransferase family protein [Lautropia sp.]
MGFLTTLKARLASGEWVAGQCLPSIRRMSVDAGVSRYTVVSAYGALVSEGVLEVQQGKGFFVSSLMSRAGCSEVIQSAQMTDPLYKLLQAPPNALKLGCGWLPLSWRDTEALAKAVRKTARSGRGALVEYGDIQGYFPLRKQLSVHLRRSAQLDVSPTQILTSLGATQALDLVLRLLVKPGDVVLVDEPCNGNLVKLIRVHGAVPVGVPRGRDGPDIAVLDRVLSAHRVKVFVCNSTYHNPTGSGLTSKVAFEVLRRALVHDFFILEDDVYGDFFPGVRQTFAGLDGLDRVIYVGSFSKTLSASLRIGYIVSSISLMEPLIRLKMLTSVAVPGFCERFVSSILVDGTYHRHAHDIQRQLMMQQRRAQKALKRQGWWFDIEPDGGMFLWVHHPDMDDLSHFIERLEELGVLLMPGTAFSVSQNFGDRTRINVAHWADRLERFFDAATSRGAGY